MKIEALRAKGETMDVTELMLFCEMMMCLDPWPFDSVSRSDVVEILNRHSLAVGFDNWIDCYHAGR